MTNALLRPPDQAPGAPLPTNLCIPTLRQLDAIPTSTAYADLSYSKADEVCTLLASDGDYSASPTTPHAKLSPFPCTAEKKGSICQPNDLERQPPNWWFDSLQDELSKMRERLSSLTTSMVPSSTSSTTIAPTSSSGSTTTAASAPSLFCTAASSSVPSEMPPSYGLHNLKRQSVLLVDGTEHIYYALPDTYPLERAVPEPVFIAEDDKPKGDSNESVDVFATTLEQQPYEGAQQESEQSRKCFSRPSENPLPEVILEFTLADNVDGSVERSIKFTHGQCIQEIVGSDLAPGYALGDVQHLKVYKWKSEEGREVWDPGASALLVTALNNGNNKDTSWPNGFVAVTNNTMEQHKGEDEQSISDLEKLNGGEDLSVVTQYVEPLLKCCSKALKYRTCDEESQDDDKILWEKNVCRTARGHSILFFLWDPGDTKFYNLFTHVGSATKLKCTYVYKSVTVQILAEQFGAKRALSFKSASMCSDTFGLGCIEVNASALFVLVPLCSTDTSCSLPCYAILLLHHFLWEFSMAQGIPMPWDPGHATVAMTCEHATTCQRMVCMEMHCCSTTVQVTEQRLALEFSLMVAMLPNGSKLRDGQLAYMSQGTSIHYPEKHVFWLSIPSQVTTASFVWGPGTMLLMYKSKSWLQENTNWNKDIECYGVALWLIHFQPP